jgi:hypothetical protein
MSRSISSEVESGIEGMGEVSGFLFLFFCPQAADEAIKIIANSVRSRSTRNLAFH